ncbi:hypothetical protein BXZ70DRAFT_918621 [Cristinia sonorae]|uniref:Uncharacterized protein n=1 Tax=Cristinia sonorae TaxID=1940300 RepID=A0A8K0UYN8_9AGAR|nr:hypothetical protein BXZ70DRAFT_918621 [Cristinia sonorae]
MVFSEDAQPNEVRLGRKGSSSVPTIRTARPPLRATFRGARGNFRGRPSQPGGSTRGRFQPHVDTPPLAGPGPSSTSSGSSSARGDESSDHLTARYPPKRTAPSAAADPRIPYKQMRVDTHPHPFHHRAQANGRHHHWNSSQGRSTHKKPSSCVELGPWNTAHHIEVELPVRCRDGQPNSHHFRKQWLQAETFRLERELYARIFCHKYVGDGDITRFSYYKLKPPSINRDASQQDNPPFPHPSPRDASPSADVAKKHEVALNPEVKVEQDEDPLSWPLSSLTHGESDADPNHSSAPFVGPKIEPAEVISPAHAFTTSR